MVAFWLSLLLSSFVMKGTAVKVLAITGRQATLPCQYQYEDGGAIKELSVQWKGPQQQLLCHFIKHKSFRNCTPGYELDYVPGHITFLIRHAAMEDAGPHICSVSKRHTFSDFVIQLSLRTQSIIEAPETNKCQSGDTGTHLPLFSCFLLVCFWG